MCFPGKIINYKNRIPENHRINAQLMLSAKATKINIHKFRAFFRKIFKQSKCLSEYLIIVSMMPKFKHQKTRPYRLHVTF